MKVGELVKLLTEFDPGLDVHLDTSADDDDPNGWEGDRVVRHVAGVRNQEGYHAVAIDACSYKETERIGFSECDN